MAKEPTVLYEDKDVVVIDKPTGLMVHPDGKARGETLVEWIMETYPEMKGVGEPLHVGLGKPGEGEDDDERFASSVVERPGIVHRLDRDTSGVLILARTQQAHEYLKERFMGRDVHKVYRAFVYGTIAEDRGTIDKPIGKSRSDFRQWSAARNPRGLLREARTDFRVITRSRDASYLELFPYTGRTHQIRVHMKAVHHPIICDELYAAGRTSLLGFARLALHSYSLRITLPSGEEKLFVAPLPPDFLEAERQLQAIGRPL